MNKFSNSLKTENCKLKNYNKGFTLLEIIFAIAIFTVLVAFAIPIGLDSYRHYLLTSEVSNFLSFLRRTQALSLSNKNSSAHGIATQANQYIIFQGANYASRNASYDENYARSSDVNITGSSEIDFAAVSGNTSASSIILSNTAGSRTITINDQGTINW